MKIHAECLNLLVQSKTNFPTKRQVNFLIKKEERFTKLLTELETKIRM